MTEGLPIEIGNEQAKNCAKIKQQTSRDRPRKRWGRRRHVAKWDTRTGLVEAAAKCRALRRVDAAKGPRACRSVKARSCTALGAGSGVLLLRLLVWLLVRLLVLLRLFSPQDPREFVRRHPYVDFAVRW
jgi:hypothetical protein